MDLHAQNNGILPISHVTWSLGSWKEQLLFCKVSTHETLYKAIYKGIGINWNLQLEATNSTLYLKSLRIGEGEQMIDNLNTIEKNKAICC